MADREPSVRRPTLHPETELPDAPHPSSLPLPHREPPALIAGFDLEHYWNATKWPVLIAVVAQAVVFTLNGPASLEWLLAILLAWYLVVRATRRSDSGYLLAVTGIGGALAGFGLALAHLVLAHRLFNLFELVSRPFITAIVAMVAGTGPVLLWQNRHLRRAHISQPPTEEPPTHAHPHDPEPHP